MARQLAERGHTVLVTARSEDAAKTAAHEIGERAYPLKLDVTSPADAAAAARWVGHRFGRLDVLINNAATTYDTWQTAADADLEVVREAAETNLYGTRRIIQEMLPLLRERASEDRQRVE